MKQIPSEKQILSMLKKWNEENLWCNCFDQYFDILDKDECKNLAKAINKFLTKGE